MTENGQSSNFLTINTYKYYEKVCKKSINDFESNKLGNYMKVFGSKKLSLETITKTLDTLCIGNGCPSSNDGGGSDNDGCDDC